MPKPISLVALLLAAVACGRGGQSGRANCGIAAMVGPSALLNQFTIPRMTLSRAPSRMPERLPARIAASAAFSSVVGRSSEADSLLLIGVEGNPPANFVLGFGVLVTDPDGTPKGVMLYEGPPIEAAPQLGTVNVGPTTAPLIGVEAASAVYEDPTCGAFPDSLRK
jgi:hypothetical protein